MRGETERVKVACLYNVCDLQRVCQDNSLKFSSDTNRFLLHLTLKKLGPFLAQKLVKNLVDKGEVKWDKEEGFEVEHVLDHQLDENEEMFYLIKWKGWSNAYNTWEPHEHLDCQELVKGYHKNLEEKKVEHLVNKRKRTDTVDSSDPPDKRQRINELMERILNTPEVTPLTLLTQSPMKKSGSSIRYSGLLTNRSKSVILNRVRGNIYNKRTKTYKELKEQVKLALKDWQKKLNQINNDPAPVTVENNVDLEGPPTTFTYINDYKAGEGVVIPDDPMVGCECSDCFIEKRNCCGPNAGAEFAYYKHSRVRVPPGTPIYECNRLCKCGKDCPNRVVQHGRKHKVCLFRTHNCRGWGVKALQKIKKGSFVMEYVGEVITNEEAERRGKIYDAEGRTYLFDLDYNDGDCPYTVDAGFYGNVAHFVNHSCDPNLAVYGVWINHLDPRLPRIALFAKRDIQRDEELTFDYMMTGDTSQLDADTSREENALPEDTSPSPDLPLPETQDNAMMPPPLPASDTQDNEPISDPFARPEPVDGFVVPTPDEDIFTSAADIDDAASDISRAASDISKAPSDISKAPSDISRATSDISRAPSDVSWATSEPSSNMMNQPNPYIRRKITSPSPAMKYRIMCQCGAANCRKYLF